MENLSQAKRATRAKGKLWEWKIPNTSGYGNRDRQRKRDYNEGKTLALTDKK